MTNLTNKLAAAAVLVFFAFLAVVGYRLLKSEMAAEIYQEQLTELRGEYDGLRDQYNTAVSRTAVTELRVTEADGVQVVIRTADGQVRVTDTPYAAGSQVYVEYMVIDGRLWIRRVFDDQTAPEQGVVIDPLLATVDWDSPKVKVSKAVSRRLDAGRWTISVTGDGSLGLARASDADVFETNPQIGEFDPVEKSTEAGTNEVGPTDVLKRVITGD